MTERLAYCKEDPTLHYQMAHHLRCQGQMKPALFHFQQVVRLLPESAAAYDDLGNAYKELNALEEAIQCYRSALYLKPDSATTCYNLGLALAEQNHLQEAQAYFQQAVTLQPHYAKAHNALGIAYSLQLEWFSAIVHYRKAVALQPHYAEVHNNLGQAFVAQERFAEAIVCFQQAVTLEPNSVALHHNLAQALMSLKKYSEAILHFQQALHLEPNDAETHTHLGMVMGKLERLSEAIAHFHKALAIAPDEVEAHQELGKAYLLQEQWAMARQHFEQSFRLQRGIPWQEMSEQEQFELFEEPISEDLPPLMTNVHKLQHDILQFEYLIQEHALPPVFQYTIATYLQLVNDIKEAHSDTELVTLTHGQSKLIRNTYDRNLYQVPMPAFTGDIFNPDLDVAAIQAAYTEHPLGLAVVDHLLAPDVLRALYQFCLKSTIWTPNFMGTIGTNIMGGFNCELLYQIADAYRQKFPAIFHNLPLLKVWAYKHLTGSPGLLPHVEGFGRVTANLWITPDEGILKPDTGGVIAYNCAATPDANFSPYNGKGTANDEAIRRFLVESRATPSVVPYRQNRVVIFDSTVYHETDTMYFKEDYIYKRLNVTMVFGQKNQ